MIPELLGLDSDWNPTTDDIWFTRQIEQGVLRACVLTIKFYRIEFGLSKNTHTYAATCDYDPTWTNEQVWSQNFPGYGHDGTWTTRIGWTRLSRLKIESRFDAARRRFPRDLSWAQCQVLMHEFVSRVLDRPDADWRWFLDNVDPAGRSVALLPPPPAALENHVVREQALAAQRAAEGRILQSAPFMERLFVGDRAYLERHAAGLYR
jgi:hypothetical protein